MVGVVVEMVGVVVELWLLILVWMLAPPIPPKPDYELIDRLEHELELGPPYLSEMPKYHTTNLVERVW
jgi:hypothetical protein